MEESTAKVRLADSTAGPVWTQAKLREETEFHDVTLVSKEGEKFPVHKLVLAVTSSYLKNKMRDNCSVIALKTVGWLSLKLSSVSCTTGRPSSHRTKRTRSSRRPRNGKFGSFLKSEVKNTDEQKTTDNHTIKAMQCKAMQCNARKGNDRA